MELKKALSNLRKDRYVSSMLREELDTVVTALSQLQAPKGPEVAVEAIAEKLSEALAMLKGERAPANSKSAPKRENKASAERRPRARHADPGGAREAASMAAKA